MRATVTATALLLALGVEPMGILRPVAELDVSL